MACECCGVTQRKLWVFGCGSVFVLLAIVLGVLWPSLSIKLLLSQLILEKGSVNYNNWIETPIPMYLEVNMFNWTNPHEIGDRTKKPHFEEIGPFIFREKHRRGIINWNENSTVTFNQQRIWEYDIEKSNHLSLETLITSANVITATVINMMKDEPSPLKKVIDYVLNNKNGSLTWRKTAREWIFDGFQDPLLDFLHTLNTSAVKIPFKEFGWLVDRNNSWTYDGIFQIKTGKDDIYDMGRQTLWNGANRTSFYDDTCAMVNGTTGELWPPQIDTTKEITIFATDICRSVSLIPYNLTVDRFGVNGNVWGTDDRCFDNGEKYSEMKCFCPRKKKRSELFISSNQKNQNVPLKSVTTDEGTPVTCPDFGVVDISECRYGAPVYVSFPHFYMAHEKYLDKIDGLKPDKNKHNFTLIINAETGIPLEVNARLQINMLMQEATGFKVYSEVNHTFVMPMFWFTQKAELTEEIASKAKLALNLKNIGLYSSYGIGALGLLILIIGIVLCITKKWKRNSQDSEILITN